MKITVDTRKYPNVFEPVVCRLELRCSTHKRIDRCNLDRFLRCIIRPEYKHVKSLLLRIRIPPMKGKIVKCPPRMDWKTHARHFHLTDYLH